MDNIVSINNLVFEYKDEDTGERTRVLDGVSLDVRRGEFLAVLGHNGSGKSTLAKHMNAILVPASGTVTVDGFDTADDGKLFDIRRRVGMVFQNPDNQMVATIVEEDVAFAPENLGVPRDEIRRRVDEALEIVGMSAFKRHAPHMLSGGQKQRVAIAGALAMRPELLVMDDSGRIALEGTPKEVFPQVEKLTELGLDVPQSTYLIYMLNKQGLGLDGTALNDEECAAELLRALEKRGKGARIS